MKSEYKCADEIHSGNRYAHTRVGCEKMKTKENGIVVESATMTRSELFSAFAPLKIFRLPFRRIHLHDPSGRADQHWLLGRMMQHVKSVSFLRSTLISPALSEARSICGSRFALKLRDLTRGETAA